MTTEGLLCTSDESEIRSKTTFQLTAKGYRVTAKLKEIDGIMQEITQEGLLGRASHQPRDDPSHPQAYILRNSLDLTSSRARQIRTGEDANDFMT